MHHICAWCPQFKRGSYIPGAGVTAVSCHVGTGIESGPVKEQPVVLAAEPSPTPVFLCINWKLQKEAVSTFWNMSESKLGKSSVIVLSQFFLRGSGYMSIAPFWLTTPWVFKAPPPIADWNWKQEVV